MTKEKKSDSSQAARVEKRVQKVFKQRAEMLRGLGLSERVPKQPHYILSTKG